MLHIIIVGEPHLVSVGKGGGSQPSHPPDAARLLLVRDELLAMLHSLRSDSCACFAGPARV